MLHYGPLCVFFFFNDTATTEIYTLSLHDALPIWVPGRRPSPRGCPWPPPPPSWPGRPGDPGPRLVEPHSALQSLAYPLSRLRRPPSSPLFPSTTLFRSGSPAEGLHHADARGRLLHHRGQVALEILD